MKIAIDATNIRAGGGLTHLREVIDNGNPVEFGIEKVVVWSNSNTLSKLPDKSWLIKKSHSWLNKSSIYSFLFQIILLSKYLKQDHIDLLFVPGGTYLGAFENVVSMSQNMLPFEPNERDRFENWRKKLRFRMLKVTQSYTFKKSKGIIFLTNYAKEVIQKQLDLKTT